MAVIFFSAWSSALQGGGGRSGGAAALFVVFRVGLHLQRIEAVPYRLIPFGAEAVVECARRQEQQPGVFRHGALTPTGISWKYHANTQPLPISRSRSSSLVTTL